ncbi:isoprenylcysteine carboxylmethyltransferase family protein (plasmid) [Photobacterium sp. GJ3]|uniref:methyltransferase family protein n=1 Tax=Photobacterium sp. GJ3 TaxID=2829502 RepID=UPI001B8CB9F0|nr:isoprenylcysteine carboxylmethyltransferase family protein [Photobacterium sp. GJ3]QUJ70605.1 isoprenylcysteine carboxylmethyltransferase family protein [Photobacterium sp. GJ3]
MQWLETKIPPVVLWLLTALGMKLAAPYLPVWPLGALPALIAAMGMTLAGCTVAVLGVWEFRRKHTTVDPRQPEKVSVLVTSGVFRYSRNPMYVGLASLLVAQTCYLQSPCLLLGVLFFIAYMNRFQIIPEARAMIQRFGDSYLNDQRQVRRWL